MLRRARELVLGLAGSRRWLPIFFLGLILTLMELRALGRALSWWVPLILVVLLVVATLPERFKAKVLEFVGAAVGGVVLLIGFNVAVDAAVAWALEDGPPVWGIWVGLPVAIGVVGLTAYRYLRVRGHWARPPAIGFALAAAVGFVLGLPALFGKGQPQATSVQPAAARVASTLEIFIVADESAAGGAWADFMPAAGLEGFDVRYSVGFADGGEVRWTIGEGPAPGRTPPDTDRVLVLLVDGTAPVVTNPAALPDRAGRGGEVARWRAVARPALRSAIPTFALLQTRQRTRLARWREQGTPIRPVSVQRLGSATIADAAARLAVAAPTADEDLLLALRFRPILLFDSGEPVPRPLAIEPLFAGGKVTLCRDRAVGGSACSDAPVTDPRELENGGTRLEFDLPRSRALRTVARREFAAALRSGAPLSSVYVHPVSREVNGKSLLCTSTTGGFCPTTRRAREAGRSAGPVS